MATATPETDLGVGAALQRTLTELLALGLLAEHAAWNVAGADAQVVRRDLGELTALTRTSVGALAERAVAARWSPDGRPASVARMVALPRLGAGALEAADAIAVISAHIGSIDARLGPRIEQLRGDTSAQRLVQTVQDALIRQRRVLRDHVAG